MEPVAMDLFESNLFTKIKVFPCCLNMSADSTNHHNNSNSNLSQPSPTAEYDARYLSSLGTVGDYIVTFYLLGIIVSSVVTNSCVIWSQAIRKNTVVSVDYYILTLAISDICSPALAYPMALWSTYSHRWSFGHTGCVVNGFLGFFFGITDIFLLSTLSVSRFICVCRPIGFSGMTKRKVAWSLVGVCLMSSFWAALPLFGWGTYGVEPFGTSCTLDWSTPDRAYITCVFLCCLALPLTVMSSCYGSILHHTASASRRLRKHNPGCARRARHETKLIKVILLMTLFFLLAWLPYAVVSMTSAYAEDALVSGPTSIVPTLLAKASHLSNPVIYITMNSRSSNRSLCCRIAVFLAGPRGSGASGSNSQGDVQLVEHPRGGKNGRRRRGRFDYEAESAVSGTANNCTVVSNTLNLVVTAEDCSGGRKEYQSVLTCSNYLGPNVLLQQSRDKSHAKGEKGVKKKKKKKKREQERPCVERAE